MHISISVNELKQEFGFQLLTEKGNLKRRIQGSYVSYAGLSLAGYLAEIQSHRVVLFGESEVGFLAQLPKRKLRERLEALFSKDIACILSGDGIALDAEVIDIAEAHNLPVLRSTMPSHVLLPRVTKFLRYALAPRQITHGVMIDVFGWGVLLVGQACIGKSECALELVKRGHRLIADDAVLIKRIADDKCVAFCSETLRHYMEIRGIGLIDIPSLFGIGAIAERKEIDLIINLERAVSGRRYERLGLEQETSEILGVPIPMITVPVIEGKNLSILVEVAAMNQHLRSLGVNTALSVANRLMRRLNPDLDEAELNAADWSATDLIAGLSLTTSPRPPAGADPGPRGGAHRGHRGLRCSPSRRHGRSGPAGGAELGHASLEGAALHGKGKDPRQGEP